MNAKTMKIVKLKSNKDFTDFIFYFLFFTFCLLLFTDCAPAKKTFPKPGGVMQEKRFDLIPKSEENFYGRRITSDIERRVKIMESEFLHNYLEKIGKRVITRTQYHYLVEGYDWSFRIVDSSEINAFATLGGSIYVYRGLLEALETESELAGILAFEIGHVMARHIHQHLSQEAVVQNKILPGEMIRGEKGLESLYQIFEENEGVFDYFAKLGFYPEEVEEADSYALRNSYDAEFDPHGLANFVSRLRERQGLLSLWLQKNPWNQEREEHLLALLDLFPPFILPEDSPEFIDFKTQFKSLTPLPLKKEEEPALTEYAAIYTMGVLGNADWTGTGYDVVKGQEIFFKASGLVIFQEGNPLALCGPEGYNLKTMQQPLSEKNIGALIGKIVQLISIEIDEETEEEIRNEMVEYFFIGSENKVVMSIDGRLFLGINENLVGDNSGEFEVTLYIKKQ